MHPYLNHPLQLLSKRNPISARVIEEQGLALAVIPASYIDDLNERIRRQTSFTLDDMSPVTAVKSAIIPTFL
ncbi:hypothetical protein [Metabacillus arenae]|uniref:hypothetical protein n=1 Tax=Metabacillus arenae TaxID=2771434 RepID=UPI001CD18278|nr:hypothetical protein [Metabacillus arenae]